MRDLTVARDLLEFSFESIVASGTPAAALQRLARQSAAFNARMGLTGRLHLEDGRFVQTLEGRTGILLPLSGRILADPRHGSIRVTAFGTIGARRYAGWSADGFDGRWSGNDGDNLHFLPVPRPEQRVLVSAAILSLGASGRLSALSDA